MINLLKRLAGGVITLGLLSAQPHLLTAQESPVLRVDITDVTTTTGEIDSLTIVRTGFGYTQAPTVQINGGITAATATATLAPSPVRDITLIDGGTNYSSRPTITISGGGGSGAAATALLNGSVTGITLKNPGAGFTSVPTVAFSGGGSGAAAEAVLDATIKAVTVAVGGSGYATPPTVEFVGGGGTGAAATATVVGGQVTTVSIVDIGSGYTSAPSVQFVGGGGTGAQATASIVGTIREVLLISGGSGYSAPPTISFQFGGGGGASATATISGPVESIFMSSGGTGYTSVPTVTLSGGGGSGATATSSITGSVGTLTVNSGGSGYLYPSVVFSDGDASATANLKVANVFNPPNESYGPANTVVTFTAVAAGTFTTGSFVYAFTVNGATIGASPAAVNGPDSASWVPPRPGVYYLGVTANDGANSATSPTVRFYATGASITSPLPNTLVPVGSSVTIKADATPQQGAISKIDFYADGALIGSDSTAPYSINYRPSAAANQSVDIRVIATDSNGSTTNLSSSVVPISLVNAIGTIPTVSVASPSDGAVLPVPTSPILISLTANDSDGRIERVETYVDGVLFSTDLAFPYTASWTPTAVGEYLLSALAYDDKNNVVSSAVNKIQISAPPVVTITSPVDGAAVAAGSPVTIKASAGDSDGTVSSVEFYANGLFIAEDFTAPYAVSWTPNEPGENDPAVALTAVATDNVGLTTVSSNVFANVQGSGGGGGGGGGEPIGVAPVVSMTSPSAGTNHTVNTSLLLTASASDSDGNVVKVQFYANSTLIGSDDVYPYSTEWTPTSVSAFSLEARATDNDGNVVTSTALTVNVIDPSGGLPTVSVNSPASGSTVQVGASASIIVAASDSDGSIQGVQVYLDGQPLGTPDTAAPYIVAWTPTSAGVYAISARATDNSGNLAVSSTISVTAADSSSAAPSVSIVSPTSGESIIAGTSTSIIAAASDSDGQIASVQIFLDGRPLGAVDTSEPFLGTWTPVNSGTYSLQAVAIDGSGNQTTSSAVTVTVISNGAPTVSLTSPTAGASLQQGTPVTLTANALDADGTIASVVFLVNGVQVGSSSALPYTTSWTPSGPGSFSVVARAVDNTGNITNSTAVAVSVAQNGSPNIALTFPGNGATVILGNSIEMQATASDTNGSIASVQFYANGQVIGTDTTGPFAASWTPNSAGIYRLSATATDNGGLLASSTVATVAVLDAAEADILYDGIYIAGFESGAFSMARQGDRGVIFIGHTDAAAAQILNIEPKIYFYSGAKVTSGGDFVLTDNGATKLSGKADTASVFGKFDSARATFSGAPKTGGASTYTGPNGVLYGSLSGASDSLFIALIGSDASATFYMRSGTNEDVSVSGNLASDGTFNVATLRGGTLSGRVDPATGFLTGTITGSPVSGTVTGAVSTPAPAADGFLRNLSTRGRVGSGDAILVAGFVVNGTSAKQVLIRAIGPTLGSFGVSGVVSDPYLKLYRGSTVLASNDDWGTAPGVPAASSIVGAFALPSGSSDSALLATLTPGPYTAQVSGVGGATGVGLVEIYDVDTQTAFSAEKVLNVSTRGEVGAGDKNLIAGVNINGTTPKRVLIRAIGPTLGEFGVSNPLADPLLRLVRQSDGVTVRENNDWGMGNEATDVAEAASAIGAFALPAGSKDAVLLITLPPGSYTALVTSGSGSTGVAIVEVYEVP